MKGILSTIDRWGPMLVSLVTLFGAVALSWQYDSRLARQEALNEGLQTQITALYAQMNANEAALRLEVQTWQAHAVALRIAMTRAGVEVPRDPGEGKHTEANR